MTRNELLDLYFMENRAKLIDIAAFLDRMDRGVGDADFRLAELRKAVALLHENTPNRAEKILLSLSDPSTEPIAAAPGKGAVGAFQN